MYTIKDILELRPCKEYTEERLKELWEDKKTLSRREILKLDIDIGDKNWVISQLVSGATVVTWSQYCTDAAKKHAVNATASARYTANAARYAAADARAAARAAASAFASARCAANAARSAGYAHATAGYARSAARSDRYAAHYANEAARSAGYAARSAASAFAARSAAHAAADAGSTWSENRGKELYRLLTVLCDMEEECTQ